MKDEPSRIAPRPSIQLGNRAFELIDAIWWEAHKALEIRSPCMSPPLPSMSAIMNSQIATVEIRTRGCSFENFLRKQSVGYITSIVRTSFDASGRVMQKPYILNLAWLRNGRNKIADLSML
ncbi:hypothetical protein [Cupriavidus pauculus]|uniref:hypothetical protein n=1 Tax=Cupriavidus pauculus TaxID=82633 RepID=UPI001EE3991C|nr:hypothetical protein [Cupriavidus pauculus]GJG93512.1 hypothetical protein CBA19C6_03505 [Cupriavidus pauculus]